MRAVQERYGCREVVDFSASINPLGHPGGLREHLWEQWDEVLHYPDRACLGFREALAARYRLPAEGLVPGNGSAELIDLVLRVLAPDRVVLCPPDFGLYAERIPAHLERALVPRDEARGFAVDLPTLARRLRPRDLVLLSSPGNPSGTHLAAAELGHLAETCRAAQAWLVLDEAFADFCPGSTLLGAAGTSPQLLVLRSLTKFYGIPGLRLGFLAAHPGVAEGVRRLQVPWSVNALAQSAGVDCLRQREWEQRSLAFLALERQHLHDGLARVPGFHPLPSAANYLLVRVTPSAQAVYETLAEQGFLVRHCRSFGLGDRYLRFAVRTRAENDRLLAALARAREARGGAPCPPEEPTCPPSAP